MVVKGKDSLNLQPLGHGQHRAIDVAPLLIAMLFKNFPGNLPVRIRQHDRIKGLTGFQLTAKRNGITRSESSFGQIHGFHKDTFGQNRLDPAGQRFEINEGLSVIIIPGVVQGVQGAIVIFYRNDVNLLVVIILSDTNRRSQIIETMGALKPSRVELIQSNIECMK